MNTAQRIPAPYRTATVDAVGLYIDFPSEGMQKLKEKLDDVPIGPISSLYEFACRYYDECDEYQEDYVQLIGWKYGPEEYIITAYAVIRRLENGTLVNLNIDLSELIRVLNGH